MFNRLFKIRKNITSVESSNGIISFRYVVYLNNTRMFIFI